MLVADIPVIKNAIFSLFRVVYFADPGDSGCLSDSDGLFYCMRIDAWSGHWDGSASSDVIDKAPASPTGFPLVGMLGWMDKLLRSKNASSV